VFWSFSWRNAAGPIPFLNGLQLFPHLTRRAAGGGAAFVICGRPTASWS